VNSSPRFIAPPGSGCFPAPRMTALNAWP
jgi:hypothetical protein